VTRDLAVTADDGALLDLDERTDPGAVADLTAIEIDEVIDLNVLAKLYVRSD
jgi:hypothetical protein